jgi:hypothetical protein
LRSSANIAPAKVGNDWHIHRQLHRFKISDDSDLCLKSTSSNDDIDSLLDAASRLRNEADVLEAKMKKSRSLRKEQEQEESAGQQKAVAPIYTDIRDSCWNVTYRFATEPISSQTNDNEKESEKPLKFFSGKLTLIFRADGYTDIVSHEGRGSSTLTFLKFWGWDEEISSEDSLRYLSWSADVDVPEEGTSRFYFNARIDEDISELGISDGKVTVKRDLEAPGGFWGVFNAAGILAQFRLCGDFLCKPAPRPSKE